MRGRRIVQCCMKDCAASFSIASSSLRNVTASNDDGYWLFLVELHEIDEDTVVPDDIYILCPIHAQQLNRTERIFQAT